MAPPTITLCDTPDALTHAVATLAVSPTGVLIVDYEGRDLGISAHAQRRAHLFRLIPALTRPTAPLSARPALCALLDLFASPFLTKVFWGGRADVLEQRARPFPTLSLSNVLDLQLLELAARAPTARQTDADRLNAGTR